MTSIGNSLRRERLNQGRSLGEIAEQTKIGSRYLEAIEADKLDCLPGTFFYKSFVRQYAGALGLPPEKYAGLVDELLGPPAEIEFTQENFPIKPLDPIVQDANRRSFSEKPVGWSMALLVVVALGCSGFYAWWHKTQIEREQHPIASMNSPRAMEAPTAAAAAGPETAQPVSVPPAQKTEPAAAPAASALSESTASAQGPVDGWQIDVSATEKTWLSIVSDGKHLFSGVLEPSESKKLQGKESARLLVGNAGGIEVHWNGKSIGRLGGRGQVCTVVFTRDNYQILPVGHAM